MSLSQFRFPFGDYYWFHNYSLTFTVDQIKQYMEKGQFGKYHFDRQSLLPPYHTPLQALGHVNEIADMIVDGCWMLSRLQKPKDPVRVARTLPVALQQNNSLWKEITAKLDYIDKCHRDLPYYDSIVKMAWASGYGLNPNGQIGEADFTCTGIFTEGHTFNKPFSDHEDGESCWLEFITLLEDDGEFLARRAYDSVSRFAKCFRNSFSHIYPSLGDILHERLSDRELKKELHAGIGSAVLQCRYDRMFEDVVAALLSSEILKRATQTWSTLPLKNCSLDRPTGWSPYRERQSLYQKQRTEVMLSLFEQAVNQIAWARVSKALDGKLSPFSPREPDPDPPAETNTSNSRNESPAINYIGQNFQVGGISGMSYKDSRYRQTNQNSSVAANVNTGTVEAAFSQQPGQGSQQ